MNNYVHTTQRPHHISYGVPLALAAIGTVVSLASPSRKAHIICGSLWLGLSVLHAWQYRRKLEYDVAELRQKAIRLGIRR